MRPGQIDRKYSKSTARIRIRWNLQHGVLPLLKAFSPEHMQCSLQVFDFELQDWEMAVIDSLPLMGYSGLDPDLVRF